NDGWLRWAVEIGFDVVDLGDLVELCDVERAVVEGDTVRTVEAGQQRLDFALSVLIDNGIDLVEKPGTDKDSPFVADPQRTCIGHAAGIDFDVEVFRGLQLCDGEFVGRRGDRRRYHRGKLVR